MSQGRVGIFLETFPISTAPNCNEAEKYLSSFDEWRTKVRRHRSRFDREYCLYTSPSRRPAQSCGPLGLVRTQRAGLTLVTRTAVTTETGVRFSAPRKVFSLFHTYDLMTKCVRTSGNEELWCWPFSIFHAFLNNEWSHSNKANNKFNKFSFICVILSTVSELCLRALLLCPGGVTPDPLLFK